MNYTHSDKGFSLIELLVVIAILGVIAALAAPTYRQYMINVDASNYFKVLDTYLSMQESYYSTHGQFTFTAAPFVTIYDDPFLNNSNNSIAGVDIHPNNFFPNACPRVFFSGSFTTKNIYVEYDAMIIPLPDGTFKRLIGYDYCVDPNTCNNSATTPLPIGGGYLFNTTDNWDTNGLDLPENGITVNGVSYTPNDFYSGNSTWCR